MKYYFFAMILFAGYTVSASSITCKVIPNKKETLIIEFEQNNQSVSSMVLQTEGASTRIFSRWPMIRGEFTVTYCNPNLNEYREHSRKYYLSAQCTSDNGERAFFESTFSLISGGTVSYLKRNLDTVELEFSDCRADLQKQNQLEGFRQKFDRDGLKN